MSDSEAMTRQRIEAAIIRALGVVAPDASTPLRMGSTPGWDSMGHMAVVLELEKEFQTRFAPYELPGLVDVASIEKTLKIAR